MNYVVQQHNAKNDPFSDIQNSINSVLLKIFDYGFQHKLEQHQVQVYKHLLTYHCQYITKEHTIALLQTE